MAHDAATAMLSFNYRIKDAMVYPYAQTQANGTLFDVLSCGARALDLRVKLNETTGVITFHHGRVNIAYNVSYAISVDVVNFLKQNTDEFVVLYWTCSEEGCYEVLNQMLLEFELPVLHDNCTNLANLDVSETQNLSRVNTGGSLLSIEKENECIEENWDPDIVCWGDNYSCTGTNSEVPFDNFWAYVNRTYEKDYNNKLWMIQAHWQATAESIVIGMSHSSSILDDTSKSGITEKFITRVHDIYSSVPPNFVEFDNVCDRTSNPFPILPVILSLVGGVILCIIIIIIIICYWRKRRARRTKDTFIEIIEL